MLVINILCCIFAFFFFKQKTAYEMRISDWSSDVCSSDLCERTSPLLMPSLARIPLVHIADRSPVCIAIFAVDPACEGVQLGANGAVEIGRASCRERVCQYV